MAAQPAGAIRSGGVCDVFFGYDITQILKHLPYEKAWEIEKRETYPDRNGKTRRIAHSPVFWKGYAISYIKGKSFDMWRLARSRQALCARQRWPQEH